MASIKPTIGRVVWFTPGPGFRGAVSEGQPLDAHVCCVLADDRVNLAGFDAEGQHYAALDVYLHPSDSAIPPPPEGPHATWMPYQVNQAADQAAKTAPRAPIAGGDVGGAAAANAGAAAATTAG